jgi:MarC family membrane protein
MDPVGNSPVVLSLLGNIEPRRRKAVGLRECAIAYGVLLIFVVSGNSILRLLGLSGASLTIAGGVILFLIALRMIFRRPEGIFGDVPDGEPFIVPLAIPSIAGPTAIATVVVLVSNAPARMVEWIAAVTVAMAATLIVLLTAGRLARLVGNRGLLAFERLMGLILTAIAIEMLLRGTAEFVHQL